MNSNIKILLIYGQEVIRHGLRHMLEGKEAMEVVGNCASIPEAGSAIVKLRPDIILMDTQISGMNVVEAIQYLRRNGLNYGGDIIILAETMDYRTEAFKTGAASYLLKDVTSTELTRVIREIYQNRRSSEEGSSLIDETIELIVVPQPANAACLLRFMCQLAEVLNNNFASIVCTIGSWEWGNVVTIQSRPAAFENLLNELANMLEVARVEDEPPARDNFFTKRFRFLSGLQTSPSRRVYVTLKETDPPKQKSTAISK